MARVVETLDRARLRAVQTPQVFDYVDLLAAHRKAAAADRHDFTDDAALAEWAGLPVGTFAGESSNIKLTTPEDFRQHGVDSARVSATPWTSLPDVGPAGVRGNENVFPPCVNGFVRVGLEVPAVGAGVWATEGESSPSCLFSLCLSTLCLMGAMGVHTGVGMNVEATAGAGTCAAVLLVVFDGPSSLPPKVGALDGRRAG